MAHRRARWAASVFVLCLTACQGGSGNGDTSANPGTENQAGWVYGLTLDAVDDRDAIVDALAGLPRKPTVRVVFDENVPPADYADVLPRISGVANVMGELLDSSAMATISRSDYVARTQAYLQAFGPLVQSWEIGNEINGDWLGSDAINKAHDAFTIIEAAGGSTTLTLHYNAGCEDTNGPMLDWVRANVPADMKAGLEQVTVSYYEDDCHHRIVPHDEWVSVFSALHDLFPSARLLMGEVGTTSAPAKATVMQRYYRDMRLPEVPSFAGGFFWWYGRQDLAPRSAPLWASLAAWWADATP